MFIARNSKVAHLTHRISGETLQMWHQNATIVITNCTL